LAGPVDSAGRGSEPNARAARIPLQMANPLAA